MHAMLMQPKPCIAAPLPRAPGCAEPDAARSPLQSVSSACTTCPHNTPANGLRGMGNPAQHAQDSGAPKAGTAPQHMGRRPVTDIMGKTSGDDSETSENAGANLPDHQPLTVPFKRKHRWTVSEKKALKQAVSEHGLDAWAQVAACVGTRTARQCVEHYQNVVGYAYA